MRPYMVTKRRCVWNKTFLLGHFMLHFIMFLIRQMTTKASNASFGLMILCIFLDLVSWGYSGGISY